jgi:hypothetical protein
VERMSLDLPVNARHRQARDSEPHISPPILRVVGGANFTRRGLDRLKDGRIPAGLGHAEMPGAASEGGSSEQLQNEQEVEQSSGAP